MIKDSINNRLKGIAARATRKMRLMKEMNENPKYAPLRAVITQLMENKKKQ